MTPPRSFDPTKPAHAKVGFRFKRRRYGIGDPFPKDGLHENQLWALWNARLIEFGEVDASGVERRAAGRAVKESRREAEKLADEAAEKARQEALAALSPPEPAKTTPTAKQPKRKRQGAAEAA